MLGGASSRTARADRPRLRAACDDGGVDRCGSGALDAASAWWSAGGSSWTGKGEWDRVSQPDSTAGGATGEQVKVPRDLWYQRDKNWHNVLCVLATTATGFLIWWIVAEAITPDGTKVWWTWRTFVHAVVVLVGGVAGWCAARKYRAWQKRRTRGEDDTSLLWLVAGGILASLVIAAAAGYAQAELLTAPGEPVFSLDSSELLDIARSTTFALGALGAVAVLLVNYRKQRSVEAALRHDQAKHLAELASENRKQRASEIAALHDRYTTAVAQLADKENPAIRLGGVHALAALGDDWAAQEMFSQRQVCVDLLCSYLRSVPRLNVRYEPNGEAFEWDWDRHFLAEDRDVRKAALEWLSRLATTAAHTACRVNEQRASGGEDDPVATVEIDLRGIALEGMDLSHAKLSHLKMPKAWLESVDLSEARMEHVDLTGAHLEDARLEETVLNNATLTGARMNTRKATNAHFVDADLKGAHLEGAKLVGANLTRAKLPGAQVDSHTSFISAILDDADFSGVDVRRLDLGGVDYSKAKNFELHPDDDSGVPGDGSAAPESDG